MSRGPVPRDELRWDTEPELPMGNPGNAEEWLELTAPDDRIPEPPLFVEVLTGWFGVGPYLDTFALTLGGRGRSLLIMTTADHDLRCGPHHEARHRAEVVAANMNQRLVEQVRWRTLPS